MMIPNSIVPKLIVVRLTFLSPCDMHANPSLNWGCLCQLSSTFNKVAYATPKEQGRDEHGFGSGGWNHSSNKDV